MSIDILDSLRDQLIEFSPELVQVIRPDGTFLGANTRWRQVLGYTPDDLSRITAFDVICEDGRPHCQVVFDRILRGEDVGLFEVPFRTKDGHRRLLEGQAVTQLDAQGQLSVVCTFRDQTTRREVEERLHDAEQRWQLAVESTGDRLFDWDVDSGGVVLPQSESGGPAAGEKRAFLTERDRIHPDDRPAFEDHLRAFLDRSVRALRAEFRVRQANGEWSWVLVRAAGWPGPDGRVTRVIGTSSDITERKALEESLRIGEAQARGLIAALPAQVIRLGRDGILKEAHVPQSAALAMPADAIGHSVTEFIGQVQADEVLAAVDRALETGQAQIFTRAYELPSGPRVFESRVAPMPPDEALVLSIDLTERRAADRSRREAEERYRTTLDAIAEGVLTLDAESRVSAMNPAALRLTGEDGPSTLGQPVDVVCRLVDELTGMDVPPLAAAAIQSGEARTADRELALLRRDGRAVSVDASAAPLRDAAGTVIGAVLVLRDMTQAREATRTLRDVQAELEHKVDQRTEEIARAASLLHSVFEASTDGILAIDAHGAVTASNRQFLTVLGLDSVSDSIADHSVIEQFARDRVVNMDALLAHTRGLFAAPEAPSHFVMTLKDGRSVDTVSQPQWADGHVVGRVFSFRDVTERLRTDLHANRAQRLEALGTLAGGIAHDLNNALAPILLVLSNLQEEFPDSVRELEILTASANRAAAMVRQLLTFARGSDGAPQVLNPRSVVQDVETIIGATFPKNIEIRTAFGRDLPHFMSDPTQVHQLLLNLCVNARDAMTGGGRLTLSVASRDVEPGRPVRAVPGTEAHPGRYVCISVEDTGTGIAPDVLDRMFEPFFTTKGIEQGTGLGLSTTLGIVKGAGGFLQVETVVRRGSRFSVWFPVEVTLAASRIEETWRAVAFKGRGELVLFVDDEPSVRAAARIVLERLGLSVALASDGADALMQALDYRDSIAAVVTDVHMPAMDGFRFIRALRQLLPDVPVIVASGRLDDRAMQECRALGVRHTLEKPFTEGTFAASLASALAERTAKAPKVDPSAAT